MTSEELVEQVAQLMDPEAYLPKNDGVAYWERYRDVVRSRARIAIRATVEACAEVANEHMKTCGQTALGHLRAGDEGRHAVFASAATEAAEIFRDINALAPKGE